MERCPHSFHSTLDEMKPALLIKASEDTQAAVTDSPTLPDVLLAKVAALRNTSNREGARA